MAGVDLIVGSGKYFFFRVAQTDLFEKVLFFCDSQGAQTDLREKVLIFRDTLILFVFRILSLILAQNIEEKVFFRIAS